MLKKYEKRKKKIEKKWILLRGHAIKTLTKIALGQGSRHAQTSEIKPLTGRG